MNVLKKGLRESGREPFLAEYLLARVGVCVATLEAAFLSLLFLPRSSPQADLHIKEEFVLLQSLRIVPS